jgi:rSAM/selenodomain-associated transferase 2
VKSDGSVSIVVPLYNEGENVVNLVQHLQALVGLREAILVDGSDDEVSRAIASKAMLGLPEDTGIRFITSDTSGRAVQMNLGADAATGSILIFLHCDTRLPEDAVSLIKQEIEKGHQWGRFDVSLESKGVVYRVIETMINLRSRVRRIATGDQAMFIAATVFRKCSGFPEIALMEDIAICKSLNRYSSPGLIRQTVITSARRWRNKGAVATIFLMWKLRLLFWLGVDSQYLAAMYQDER